MKWSSLFKKKIKNGILIGMEKYRLKEEEREIHPEEILLDAERPPESKFEDPIKQSSLIWLYRISALVLLALLIRAGQLQIGRANYYRDLAYENSIRFIPIKAPRGIIYDSKGGQLLSNVSSFDLIMSSVDLPKGEELDKLIKELAVALDESPDDLKNEIESLLETRTHEIVLRSNVEHSKALVLESKLGNRFQGIRVVKNTIRNYKEWEIFAHVLGYTSFVTEGDLARLPDYEATDYIGRAGLEAQYESFLKGIDGVKQIAIDSLGRFKRNVALTEAQPGKGLQLFLDAELQRKVTDVLDETLKELNLGQGAVIAMNPKNGGVLALVSLPSFDNNLFAQGMSKGEYERLLNDPRKPLFNRAISGQYPPGSTIKPLIAVAALEEGVVDSGKNFLDKGWLEVPHQYDPGHIYTFYDWKAHGWVDMRRAIAWSANVYFYIIGGGFESQEGLGINRIKKYASLFGLGKRTGIDLPNEAQGLIPDAEWKKGVKGEDWYIGDTYHTSIGQGDISITPLQLASYMSTIVNGGKLFEPLLVDKIIDSDKNVIRKVLPLLIKENFAKAENLEVVKEGMREAVLSGSAQRLASLPIAVAAKTGTAQFGNEGKTHAWTAAFAPYEDPEIVLAVLLEEGGEGSQVAVPVVQEIFDWYFSNH